MRGLDTLDPWKHPAAVLKARALGQNVSCMTCHHRQFGQFSNADEDTDPTLGAYQTGRFCRQRLEDPYPHVPNLEDQVCKQWKPEP